MPNGCGENSEKLLGLFSRTLCVDAFISSKIIALHGSLIFDGVMNCISYFTGLQGQSSICECCAVSTQCCRL